MEEDGLPVVRAEVLELFGETLFQSLNHRFQEHQALLSVREKKNKQILFIKKIKVI